MAEIEINPALLAGAAEVVQGIAGRLRTAGDGMSAAWRALALEVSGAPHGSTIEEMAALAMAACGRLADEAWVLGTAFSAVAADFERTDSALATALATVAG